MPSLAEYQQAMHAYLLAGQEVPQPLTKWCTGESAATAARLSTYRGTAQWTLVNALRLSYPAVRQVVGAEFFDAVAADFVRIAPPATAYLNDYGAAFARFVAELPATASLSYMSDLAALEWAVNRALHAPDVPGLDPQRLQALEPAAVAQLCFRAHPGVSVLLLRFPAERIWQAVLERDEAGMRDIDLASGAAGCSSSAMRPAPCRCAACPRRSAASPRGCSAARRCTPPWRPRKRARARGELLEAALADHLARGRLVDFYLTTSPREEPAI